MAVLAAVLLAISPTFLFYGRSATDVGISLAPALLTIYVLIRLLREPQRWPWLLALQVLLVVNSYAYSPVRFLWPLSLCLIGMELLLRPAQARRWLGLALAATVVVLPLSVAALDRRQGEDPRGAMSDYFNARGEQVLTLNKQPAGYAAYLELTPAERTAGRAEGNREELALRLIKENTRDLAKMLLAIDRRPTVTDYWNSSGRFYPLLLVPFFLAGIVLTLRRAVGRMEERVLLALFGGFTLPLLLTSRVDIGRLIFALPLLLLLVAIGFSWTAARTVDGAWLLHRFRHDQAVGKVRLWAPALLTAALLAVAGWLGWHEYTVKRTPPREPALINELSQSYAEVMGSGGAVFVAGGASQRDGEGLTIAVLRLRLQDRYQFIDLAGPELDGTQAAAGLPALYYGGVLDLMDEPSKIPGLCENVYFIMPEAMERFSALAAGMQTACTRPLITHALLRP